MTWVLFALTTALALSTADALSKRALGKTDDLVIVWVREGYALPFLALALFFVPVPALDPVFWLTVAGLVPLEVISLVLYIKAIRLSPLSLTVPFLAMSPVFIIFIAFAEIQINIEFVAGVQFTQDIQNGIGHGDHLPVKALHIRRGIEIFYFLICKNTNSHHSPLY
jgi:drug/metabolite transporter (DMT)-like permease